MSSAIPPAPVVFVRDGDLLSRIREQITEPPDPRVLPWTPPPDYDAQAVALRARLDRAAKAKKEEAARAPVAPEAPKRVESAFGTAPRAGEKLEGGGVDFSTLGSFAQKTELTAAPRKPGAAPFPPPETEPEPERPASAFGFAQGAFRPKKKTEDEKKPESKRRQRVDEGDFLGRLKTEFRKE